MRRPSGWLGVFLAAAGCIVVYLLWLSTVQKRSDPVVDVPTTSTVEQCDMRICGDEKRRMKTFYGDECVAIRNAVALHGEVRMCWTVDHTILLEDGNIIIPSFGQDDNEETDHSTGWHYKNVYASGGYVGRRLGFCGQGPNRRLIPEPVGIQEVVQEGDALIVDTHGLLPVCISPFSIDTLARHGR